jgi:hypothetical protein
MGRPNGKHEVDLRDLFDTEAIPQHLNIPAARMDPWSALQREAESQISSTSIFNISHARAA